MGEIRKQVTSAAWSLPRWTEEPPEPDTTGVAFLLVSYGGLPAESVLERWRQALADVGVEHATRVWRAPHFDESSFWAALDTSRCGTRLMVAGPQYDVLRAASLARQLGLEHGEITSYATSAEDLPLFCPHCQHTTRAYAVPFDVSVCGGCQRGLMVRPHFSSLRGSFLGVDAGATGIPAAYASGAAR